MSSIIRATTTSGLQVAPDNSGSLQLQTNGTTAAVTIDTSQNVGIGTTSPTQKLDVNGGINAAGNIHVGLSNYTANDSGGFWASGSNTYTCGWYSSSGAMLFRAGGTAERMRIDSSGNVLVGTTSAGDGKVRISANANAFNPLKIDDTGSTGGNYIQFLNSAGNQAGAINHNGTTSVNYGSGSDYRLKENITPMANAIAKVAQLKPVTYTWKADGSFGEGFIAHELQAVVPDAVVGEKDAIDAEGKPVYQSVDTSFLVATLTAAIQEQQTIINDLKARIETLEAR